MTIIDTTNYLNGKLRLSRHGAGTGGNVLLHVESGDTLELSDADVVKAQHQIRHMAGQVSAEILFSALSRIYAPKH